MSTTRRVAESRQVPARRGRPTVATSAPGRPGGDPASRVGTSRPAVVRYRASTSRPTRCDGATRGGWSSATLAGEATAAYDGDEPQGCAVCEGDLEVGADPVRRLEAAVLALREREVDELSEAELSGELAVVDRMRRQLEARSTRVAGALAQRRTRRAVDADRAAGRPTDASRASERAKRQLRNELSGQFEWTPADAKRAVELGAALGSRASQETREAFEAGELSARHASLLADTLRWFDEPAERAEVEALLLEAARREHPVAFGRTCRQLLAERDHDAAMTGERRRHARRAMSVWQTEDGMVGFRGQLAGLDGELLLTGQQAFRRPDAPGEHRTTEQASADAFVAMIRAALDAGKAPTTRAVRPHVTVHLDWQTILAQAGVAHTRWSGPMPFGEILKLLADCGVSRLLTDARGVPTEAGVEVRTVPAGTSRAVAARDRTCIADGCDVPAEWCQMMHLDTPYRLGGRLTPATAAPGCSHHHYLFDHKGWVVSWVDDDTRPVLHHPDHPPGSRLGRPPTSDRPEVIADPADGRPPDQPRGVDRHVATDAASTIDAGLPDQRGSPVGDDAPAPGGPCTVQPGPGAVQPGLAFLIDDPVAQDPRSPP